MPGKNNASAAKGKGFNRKNQYANTANTKVLDSMLKDGFDHDSMRLAKVTKNVGNSRFLTTLSDGRAEVNVLVRNVLRGKQATPIGISSIILVSLPDWEKDAATAVENGGALVKDPVAYVEAILDKKTIRALDKDGQMPPSFMKEGFDGSSGDEDGFVFEDGEEDEESKEEDEESNSAAAAPPKKKWAGHSTAAPRGGDLDIDNI
jgi:hypothetical protein